MADNNYTPLTTTTTFVNDMKARLSVEEGTPYNSTFETVENGDKGN